MAFQSGVIAATVCTVEAKGVGRKHKHSSEVKMEDANYCSGLGLQRGVWRDCGTWGCRPRSLDWLKDTERSTEVWGWHGVFPEGLAIMSIPVYLCLSDGVLRDIEVRVAECYHRIALSLGLQRSVVSRPCERMSLATSPIACSFLSFLFLALGSCFAA